MHILVSGSYSSAYITKCCEVLCNKITKYSILNLGNQRNLIKLHILLRWKLVKCCFRFSRASHIAKAPSSGILLNILTKKSK